MSSEPQHPKPIDRRAALFLIAFFAGPFAWMIDFFASLALVSVAEASHDALPLHVATAVAIVLIGAGAALGVHLLRTARGDGSTDGTGASRERFLAIASLVACAFFFVLIAGNAIPSLVHDPRER